MSYLKEQLQLQKNIVKKKTKTFCYLLLFLFREDEVLNNEKIFSGIFRV